MFLATIITKELKAKTVLFDSWYGSVDNLKPIHRASRYFVTTLKANRMGVRAEYHLQLSLKQLQMILA